MDDVQYFKDVCNDNCSFVCVLNDAWVIASASEKTVLAGTIIYINY